jgi:riboflavin biosynthesis pyrimidine reductase
VTEPSFEVLSGESGGDRLPAERPYGGALRFPDAPRPYVVVNFVATIDGVASLGITDGTDSTKVGASSRADRYLMALLRATADVIVIGAGDLRATPGHQWVPAAVAGDHAAVINEYRAERHGSPEPAPLVVVSASGDLPTHVALDQPATSTAVLTSAPRAVNVRRAHSLVQVLEAATGTGGLMDGADILAAVSSGFGSGVVLCEGGPSLFGSLLAARAVHELFLTVSPRIAGREHDQPRLGIVNAWAASPDALRRATLASVRRSEDHLFLRYRLET